LTDIGKLTALLELQTRQYDTMMKKSARTTEKQFKKMKKSSDLFSKSLKALPALMGGVAVGAMMRSMVEKFKVQETAIRSIQVALEQQGAAWDEWGEKVLKQADELAKAHGYANEEIMQTMAIAMNTGADYAQVLRYVSLGHDIARATGEDLEGIMKDLGKTIAGDVMAFGELVPEIALLGEEGTKVEQVMRILEKTFKGQAERLTQTMSSQREILANQWGDLLEEFGGFLLIASAPAVKEAIKLLIQWSESIKKQNELAPTPEIQKTLDNMGKYERKIENLTERISKMSLQLHQGVADDAVIQSSIDNLLMKRDLYKDQLADEKLLYLKQMKLFQLEQDRIKTSRKTVVANKDVSESINDITSAISLLNGKLIKSTPKSGTDGAIESAFGLNGAKLAFGKVNGEIQQVSDEFTRMEMLGVNTAHAIAGAFSSWAYDTKQNIGDVAEQFARQMAAMIAQAAVLSLLTSAFDASGVGFLMRIGSFLSNAHGNVFNDGRVEQFAQGGVVYSPTVFPMRNGAGLMGEAGPEAVMPLTRTSGGDLGVKVDVSDIGLSPVFNVMVGGEEVRAVIQRLDRFDSERGVK